MKFWYQIMVHACPHVRENDKPVLYAELDYSGKWRVRCESIPCCYKNEYRTLNSKTLVDRESRLDEIGLLKPGMYCVRPDSKTHWYYENLKPPSDKPFLKGVEND